MKLPLRTFAAALISIVIGATQPASAGTFGNDYRVRVVNNSSESIYYIYATNRDSGRWDVDLLGSSTIPPGNSRIINLDDYSGYCMYDLKAVSAYGAEWVRWNVNVCSLGTWTLWD
jgi:hypothetical protein